MTHDKPGKSADRLVAEAIEEAVGLLEAAGADRRGATLHVALALARALGALTGGIAREARETEMLTLRHTRIVDETAKRARRRAERTHGGRP